MHIFVGFVFIAFYIHAALQCKKMRAVADQPANIGFFIFAAKAILAILSMTFQMLATTSIVSHYVIIFMFGTFSALHWILYVALICAVLSWRKLSWSEEKKPLQFVGIAIILELIAVLTPKMLLNTYLATHAAVSVVRMMSLFSIVTGSLALLAYTLLLKALFAWRGYPIEVKLFPSIPTRPTAAHSASQATETALPSKGMFDEIDHIPYICGVMLIGGLFAVPIIWGSASQAGYFESIIPSLVSCGLFAYAHDKRGNFNLGRFALMFFYILFIVMRSSAESGMRGGSKPFFLAGGLLGYFVMFLCGWAGIKIGRFYRTQYK